MIRAVEERNDKIELVYFATPPNKSLQVSADSAFLDWDGQALCGFIPFSRIKYLFSQI